MAIISGVNIPDNILVEVALTSIFGIGNYQAKIIVEKSGIKLNSVRVKDLSDEELGTIRSNVDSSNLVIEGDLKREIQLNVHRIYLFLIYTAGILCSYVKQCDRDEHQLLNF